jgi:uncharacterized membrane protein YoaK (UPF0700 family)
VRRGDRIVSRIPAPRWVSRFAFLVDLLVLVVFVAVGRRSHDEGSGLEGFVRVLWPFAVGLVVATLASGVGKHPFERGRVVAAWLGTVAVGMVLRIAVQDREFKLSFVIVTTLFFGAGMLGWRAIVKRTARRKLKPLR